MYHYFDTSHGRQWYVGICISDDGEGTYMVIIPPPQHNLKVAQYNQIYCRKVKSISAMDFQYCYFVSIFTTVSILSKKNAKIHKNHTQSMLFICLFITLYGCYGILLYWKWKPHVLRFFWYLTFDILTIGHEMAIKSVTLDCKKISEISFVSHCYVPYFEGSPSKENQDNYK